MNGSCGKLLVSTILAAIAISGTCLASTKSDAQAELDFSEVEYNNNEDSLFKTVELPTLSVTAIKGFERAAVSQSNTVTRISSAEAESMHITDARTATACVPNLIIPEYGSRMTSTIYIRGMGARIDQPVMGLTVDNVPIMNKDNYDFDIDDISTIEVARGSQSTLYGRNTAGGVINVTTISPLDWQGARLAATYGSGNTFTANVGYYHALNSQLGLSIAARYHTTDGFFTNLYNGKECDNERQWNARLKVQWRPNDALNLENVASVNVVRQGGYPYQYIETGEINYNDTCYYHRTNFSDGLTIGTRLGGLNLMSVTSYQYTDDNMTLDQDFLPESYFTLTQAKREHALTEEIIVRNINTGNCYDWVSGAFAFYKSYDMKAPVTFLDYGIDQLILKNYNNINGQYYPMSWSESQFTLDSKFTSRNYGIALYHQSSLNWGRWSATAGVRIDYERATLDYHSNCQTGYDIMSAVDGSLYLHRNVDIDDADNLSLSFWEFLPKLSISYSLKSAGNVYVSVGRGYKAGGFNTQMFSDVLQQRLMTLMGIGAQYDVDDVVTYKPEHSWTFETGTHLNLIENSLKIDATIFYIDCTDQQLTMFPDGTTTGRVMTNAGHTRSYGLELSIKTTPVKNFDITATYGYTNARFIEFNNGQQDFSHKTIPYAPQNTIFAQVNYILPIQSHWLDAIVFGANVKAVGKTYWDEANEESQPLYALLGASVKFLWGKVSAEIHGYNLTDTDYSTFRFVSMSNSFLQRGKPRQVYATLRIEI